MKLDHDTAIWITDDDSTVEFKFSDLLARASRGHVIKGAIVTTKTEAEANEHARKCRKALIKDLQAMNADMLLKVHEIVCVLRKGHTVTVSPGPEHKPKPSDQARSCSTSA